ncbi:hypothetical protein RSOL_447020 [Rhizoctonia solani AG-3 Rhs1AP]|uniref:Uncharacterized protein n=1 Tax=Rhizoctonia solani AG-3 Rhs1AP TaxID=1086054 RepID=X8JQM5_9AGAM|nr:hypothetical protein RSOL_447020 [Rhizoctonia solani AG-3 Rhs1AP]
MSCLHLWCIGRRVNMTARLREFRGVKGMTGRRLTNTEGLGRLVGMELGNAGAVQQHLEGDASPAHARSLRQGAGNNDRAEGSELVPLENIRAGRHALDVVAAGLGMAQTQY